MNILHQKGRREVDLSCFRRGLIIVRLIQLFISKTYHKFFNVAICLAQNG